MHAAFPAMVSGLDGTAETAKKMLYDALSIGLPDPNAEHVAVLAGYELTKHAKDNSHVDVVKNQLAGFIEAWRSKGV